MFVVLTTNNTIHSTSSNTYLCIPQHLGILCKAWYKEKNLRSLSGSFNHLLFPTRCTLVYRLPLLAEHALSLGTGFLP